MKHVVWKFFWNYESEEKWLNEMAAKGFALYSYSWGRYVFEECEPGEYVYRLELLKDLPSKPESMAYLGFLEETGIACVATHLRWVYLQKRSADGPFDLYTDTRSALNHYQNITNLWNTLAFLEIFASAVNFGVGFYRVISETGTPLMNFLFGTIFLALGCLFYYVGKSPRSKSRELSAEQNIRE
ncbi:DUF2812 domain-containing protein [Methanocorpusculum sp. MG]|uniref:DUF2812 domain-containing protein n=1 Tax=Methanocorpusculum petauri TaxID=3002863 RepID=A0ABT4IDQ2_9EURY|nr:DUF2812 domain-containing protein [Methanocorpusculum petauri]MCZ0859873.1 DUF2812 domain-containing protein [Methanocorpusculum petauri]